jgi:peptide/nickel transport system substrate-binding protein
MPSAERSAAATLTADTHTLLVARDLSDAKTLDPDRVYEPTGEVVINNAYDSLVTLHGEDLTHVRPSLATRWTISSNNRVFTFFLRHGVRFSNGDPLTAADVVFSYRRLGYLDDTPAFFMGAHNVGNRVVIDEVKALGSYTVQFILPSPDVSFLAALTALTTVLDARVVRAHGGDDSPNAATSDKATGWLNEHSIGTGPFALSSWTRGSGGEIVLARNPYYWGKKPSLTHIIFQGIPSATTQRFEVQHGTVDMASNVDIDGAKSLRHSANVSLVTGNTLDMIYLAMTSNPDLSMPLSHSKVRQAVRSAVDYHGIIQGLLSGIGTQSNGMIPVGLLGNGQATNNSLKPRTNLPLARRLLTQAGYPHGFSTTLAYPTGFTLDGVTYDVLAPKVAHDLAAVGIHVTLDPTPLSVLLPAYRAAKVAFTLWFWIPDYPDPNDNAILFSPGGFVAQHVRYTSKTKLTSLVARADMTADPKRRAGLYREIQQVWLKEGPWAPIVQPRGIVILHRGVTNYRFSPVIANNFSVVRKR